jgi:hypothetical protein
MKRHLLPSLAIFAMVFLWAPAMAGVVLNGTGAPSAAIGTDGDLYFDTVARIIYGPKTGGDWPSATAPLSANPEFESLSVGPSNSHPVLVLAQSAVPVSVGGTLDEVVLATVEIPANTMGANGMVRIWATYECESSANNKKLYVRWGTPATTAFATYTLTNHVATSLMARIANKGATNSQSALTNTASDGLGTTSTGSIRSYSLDTTVAQNIYITGQTTLETAINPTDITGDGATATATFATDHGFLAGEYVKIDGATPATADGDPVEILTVPTSTTFTYASTLDASTSVQPDIQRYSEMTLTSYTVEVVRAD